MQILAPAKARKIVVLLETESLLRKYFHIHNQKMTKMTRTAHTVRTLMKSQIVNIQKTLINERVLIWLSHKGLLESCQETMRTWPLWNLTRLWESVWKILRRSFLLRLTLVISSQVLKKPWIKSSNMWLRETLRALPGDTGLQKTKKLFSQYFQIWFRQECSLIFS
jgi:hypothetical protein